MSTRLAAWSAAVVFDIALAAGDARQGRSATLLWNTYNVHGYVRPKIPNTVSSSSVIASTKVTRATMS